ncbi:MAG: gluconate transporter [Bacteroidetes bacterium]|nr:gluconate transporter [Bacteroidota bacterium]
MTILIIILAIALQVLLTIKKVSPFISLLVVSVLAGLCLGMAPDDLLKSIENGVGSTMGGGGLALIICFGAILGKILEESGAAEKIATTLIHAFGEKNIQWAVMLTGFLIGIPLYYNAGFIILVPLVFTLTRKTKLPLLYIAIPMATSLSTTHCFLPPHPGPVILVNAFKANMGKTLLYGICIAIPAVIIAGPILGRQLRNIQPGEELLTETVAPSVKILPSALPSFLIALLPVLLITLAVIAENFLPQGILQTILLFTGNSTIALLIAVLVAFIYFGHLQKVKTETQMRWLSSAISGIAMILLIITAGGVFKQVLTDSGTGNYIASFSSKWNMPPLVFAWVITALLRVMIGSASVAAITAAGLVAPLLGQTHVSPELMVLAVGSGSVFGSHINDSGFWMYKEFFKLSLKQTLLSWTVMETTISIVGLIGVLLLNCIVH